MRLEQLTNRELDIMARALRDEYARRHEAARQRLREAARWGRLSGSTITSLAERRKRHTHALRPGAGAKDPRHAGGLVLEVRGKVRIVACATCPETFETPLKRGRAPRSCPTCKGSR